MISRTFLRFAVIGCVGFATDAGLLALLVQGTPLGPYLARMVSFPAAVTVTWYLNRRYTFAQAASARRSREWGRYFLVSSVGSAVNLAVYLACVSLSAAMFERPVLALAVASVAAMIVNYEGSRRHAFDGS